MPINLAALKSELVTDPLARNYAALGDEAAAARINVVDRPFDGPVPQLFNYLLVNKNRSNAGTDIVTTSMLGRLVLCAGAAVGTSLFGSGTLQTLDMQCSALAMLEMVRNPNIASLPYHTPTMQQILTDLVNAQVMKAADRTAIIAFSNNHQSRAAELGLGSVTTSDVAAARAS